MSNLALEMRPGFWRGKRVFLTGHTGFKGSWLSLMLQQLGADVTGYALAPDTVPDMFTLAKVAEGMDSVIGDVRDADALYAAMTACNPEIVLHLAAQPLVRLSYAKPAMTFDTNVMGTVNVLDAVRACDTVRAVVVVTSDKCYENREITRGYREDEAMGGHDPYSASKGCAELVAAAYRNSFFKAKGIPLATARAGNVIGGGDWAADRLVPDILRAMHAGEVLEIRNPGSVRPWQHVLEPLAGYLLLAERLYHEGNAFAEGWNFGPGDEDIRPVSWIVERLGVHAGKPLKVQSPVSLQPHEAKLLALDSTKARTKLGWQPRWSLDAALGQIMAWHVAWAEGADMHDVTLSQIEHFAMPVQSRRAA